MATRHLKNNEHRYAFIKDTLTINFHSSDSDEKVNAKSFKQLMAMQNSSRIQIFLNIFDTQKFLQSEVRELLMKHLDTR